MKPNQEIRLSASISYGINAALVSLPSTIVFGVIAFKPLGEVWSSIGIMIFLISHALVGLVLSLLPTTRYFVYGAASYQAIGYSAVITAICGPAIGNPEALAELVPVCLIAVFMALFLSSSLQAFVGYTRISFVLRSIPYPIISSMINVTALLIILNQLPYMLGISADSFKNLFANLSAIKWLVVTNAALSIGLANILPKRVIGIPNIFLVVAFSIGFHYLTSSVLGRYDLVGDTLPNPQFLMRLNEVQVAFGSLDFSSVNSLRDNLHQILISVLFLTVMNSLGTITSNRILLESRQVEESSDKLIYHFGLANLIASPLLINGYAKPISTRLVLHRGADPRVAGIVAGTAYITVILFISQAELIPKVSLSVLAVIFATKLFDGFGRELFYAFVRFDRRKIRDNFGEYATVVVVICVAVFSSMIEAIVAGVVISLIDFTYKISYFRLKEPSFATMRSNVERSTTHNESLLEKSDLVTIIRLEGFILFSVAERLFERLRNKINKNHKLILDFKNVKYMDRTGVVAIGRILTQAEINGCQVLGSGFKQDTYNKKNSATWRSLRDNFSEENQFDDIDLALEAVENNLLSLDYTSDPTVLRDEELDLFFGMSEDDIAICKQVMDQRNYNKDDIIVPQGSESDELYCITHGRVDIALNSAAEKAQDKLRIASFSAGSLVGEMSFIDGKPRSASLIANSQTRCLVLSRQKFELLVKSHPTIAVALVINQARSMSYRLRLSNEHKSSSQS